MSSVTPLRLPEPRPHLLPGHAGIGPRPCALRVGPGPVAVPWGSQCLRGHRRLPQVPVMGPQGGSVCARAQDTQLGWSGQCVLCRGGRARPFQESLTQTQWPPGMGPAHGVLTSAPVCPVVPFRASPLVWKLHVVPVPSVVAHPGGRSAFTCNVTPGPACAAGGTELLSPPRSRPVQSSAALALLSQGRGAVSQGGWFGAVACGPVS